MTVFTPDIRDQIDALTEWWEAAGVPVDQREIDRLIREAEAQLAGAGSSTVFTTLTTQDQITRAKALARDAADLPALIRVIETFDGCDLKRTATRTVISDGVPDGGIMLIGEGPGREEDIEGRPFVGPAGALLDKMLASIGLSRETNTYITNVNFWRPQGNRNPTDEELAICRPFVDRQIALIRPKLIIAAGAVPAKSLLGVEDGITKLRGKSYPISIDGVKDPIPVFPVFHPAYLLRRPAEKARAWSDLLNILAHLTELGLAPKSGL